MAARTCKDRVPNKAWDFSVAAPLPCPCSTRLVQHGASRHRRNNLSRTDKSTPSSMDIRMHLLNSSFNSWYGIDDKCWRLARKSPCVKDSGKRSNRSNESRWQYARLAKHDHSAWPR
eukprot:7136443-Pyramimonas_sp.AAC.1